MQKFKQGDLIIKNGKMYFARLVGEKETLFEEIELYGFKDGSAPSGYMTFGSQRSIIIPHTPESCKTGNCAPRSFNAKSGRIEPEQREGTYPILGYVNVEPFRASVMLDMHNMCRYYPELAVQYSNNVAKYAERKIAEKQPGYGTAAAGPTVQRVTDIMGAKSRDQLDKIMARPITEEDLVAEKAPRKAPRKPVRKPAKKAAKKPVKKTARKR